MAVATPTDVGCPTAQVRLTLFYRGLRRTTPSYESRCAIGGYNPTAQEKSFLVRDLVPPLAPRNRLFEGEHDGSTRTLMPEVPYTGKHHRQSQAVGCVDDILIAD